MSRFEELVQDMYDVKVSSSIDYREFSDKPEGYEWGLDEYPFKAEVFKGDSTNPEAPGNEYGCGYGDNEEDALNQAMLNRTIY